MIDPATVAILGVFFGCLVRTLLPFLSKLRDEPNLKFDRKFVITSVIIFLSAITFAITLIPSIQIPEGVPLWLLFGSAFTFAYTANDLANKSVQ
jgi:hypothetical protein